MAAGSLACTPSGHEPAPPAPAAWTTSGTLQSPEQASTAFTYDPELAPVGAQVAVTITRLDNSTAAELNVTGMLPNRGYAAHLHTDPCGPEGAAAGPHFQHQEDPAATPEQPSTDPAFANPENEIWLDLRTDATGAGSSRTEVPFTFTDRLPGSLVIHAEPRTATGPGMAGTAGARIACLTLSTP